MWPNLSSWFVALHQYAFLGFHDSICPPNLTFQLYKWTLLWPFFSPHNSSLLSTYSNIDNRTFVLRLTILASAAFLPPSHSFSGASTMSLSRVPLPSFALVLTSDVVFLPTRPSVIKVGFDPLRTVYPAASAHEHASVCLGSFFLPRFGLMKIVRTIQMIFKFDNAIQLQRQRNTPYSMFWMTL